MCRALHNAYPPIEFEPGIDSTAHEYRQQLADPPGLDSDLRDTLDADILLVNVGDLGLSEV